jgi:hypothetical protein
VTGSGPVMHKPGHKSGQIKSERGQTKMKNHGIYVQDTNRGQCPETFEEALDIAERAGYSKEEIDEYFGTNQELTISWEGWHFRLVV